MWMLARKARTGYVLCCVHTMSQGGSPLYDQYMVPAGSVGDVPMWIVSMDVSIQNATSHYTRQIELSSGWVETSTVQWE